ncbi:helix-turn-helix domain-containing protein [Micromonospora chersina]|uniref:helix-turn-helix domain-containing protein n=1 Tax=Micromonospora chersina TaxID=47854 RepID=UPI003711E5C0
MTAHHPKENTVPGCELSTYHDLAQVLADLPRLLRAERRRRQLSVRAAARELGCSFATVSRIESGEDCVLSNAVTVLRWLDEAEPTSATEAAQP